MGFALTSRISDPVSSIESGLFWSRSGASTSSDLGESILKAVALGVSIMARVETTVPYVYCIW